MDFLSTGIPIGTYWGIHVRLHFTFFIYAVARVTSYQHLGYGLAFVVGLYACILLHEFGHALAARWCDGEAPEILLWPLGGLAFVRPAFHPTAHLITTVAGPFVTLVLWALFLGSTLALDQVMTAELNVLHYLWWFTSAMAHLNLWLLVFNLIPAFPMDGGRILRDTLWHFMSAETATRIAVWVSRILAGAAIAWGAYSGEYMLIFVALFVFLQCTHEVEQIVGAEGLGTYQFSIRERLARGKRQRAFYGAVKSRQKADAATAFHRCFVCGKTDHDHPTLDFRVCTDCAGDQEYCPEHLNAHRHT